MLASIASLRPSLKGTRMSPQRATEMANVSANKSAAEVRTLTKLEMSAKVLFKASPSFSSQLSLY
jgi:hypothetical protein